MASDDTKAPLTFAGREAYAKALKERRQAMPPNGWSQSDLAVAILTFICTYLESVAPNWSPTDPNAYSAFGNVGDFTMAMSCANYLKDAVEKVPSFASLVDQAAKARAPIDEALRGVPGAPEAYALEVKRWRDRVAAVENVRARVSFIFVNIIDEVFSRAANLNDRQLGVQEVDDMAVPELRVQSIPLVGILPSSRTGNFPPPDPPQYEVAVKMRLNDQHVAMMVMEDVYEPHFYTGELLIIERTGVFADLTFAIVSTPSGDVEITATSESRSKGKGFFSIRQDQKALPENSQIFGYIVHRQLTSPSGMRPHTATLRQMV